jgi:hypothetical protein
MKGTNMEHMDEAKSVRVAAATIVEKAKAQVLREALAGGNRVSIRKAQREYANAVAATARAFGL